MRIHRRRNQKPKIDIPQFNANDRIHVPQVRVIDEKGEMLGVLDKEKAVALAQERGLDLVEVNPKANPPVCKLLNFGQFKYQKEKEARKQKAQSAEVEIKGIRLSLRIGDHDLETRHLQAKKFFERGDKVKVDLPLRGREKAFRHGAEEVINRLIALLKADYPLRIEQPLAYQNGRMTVILARE